MTRISQFHSTPTRDKNISASAAALATALRTWGAPNHAGRINALNQYCTKKGMQIVRGMDRYTPRKVLEAACERAVNEGY